MMIELSERGEVLLMEVEHGKANAMDVELLGAISDAFDGARDNECRAVVLTAKGRSFCAGVDLPRVVAGGEGYLREFLPLLSAALETVYRFPKPVVAAINGHAIAGGFILACACDIRVAAESNAKLGVTELLVGVPFPVAAFELVRSVAGRSTADLMYSGRLLAPEEALRFGLVNELVRVEDLVDRALDLAGHLGSRPADVFALTKARIQEPVLRRIERDRESYDRIVERAWSDPETLANIRQFVEKTLSKRA